MYDNVNRLNPEFQGQERIGRGFPVRICTNLGHFMLNGNIRPISLCRSVSPLISVRQFISGDETMITATLQGAAGLIRKCGNLISHHRLGHSAAREPLT